MSHAWLSQAINVAAAPSPAPEVDANTGWLHQIFLAGTFLPMAAMPIGTGVEMVEKSLAATPNLMDGYLLAAGTVGGMATADVFDRTTMLSTPLMTYMTRPATSTGIASTTGADVYVSANAPGGIPGYLLHLNLTLMAFMPAPVATYTSDSATDVSVAGQFISVLTTDSASVEVVEPAYGFRIGLPAADTP